MRFAQYSVRPVDSDAPAPSAFGLRPHTTRSNSFHSFPTRSNGSSAVLGGDIALIWPMIKYPVYWCRRWWMKRATDGLLDKPARPELREAQNYPADSAAPYHNPRT